MLTIQKLSIYHNHNFCYLHEKNGGNMVQSLRDKQRKIAKLNANWLARPSPDPKQKKKTKVKAHPWKYTYKTDL